VSKMFDPRSIQGADLSMRKGERNKETDP